MRRVLGPVGGPIVFFLVAALVFGGLGWVTHTALKVEQAQRETAAQAELGNDLRVALWRLDGRMLPALGVEDSRPYYHYAPADPSSGYAAVATPLLTANLPEWMKLHFQCDPTTGWESPQVLPPEVAQSIRRLWPDVRFRNLNGSRESFLNEELKGQFPHTATCDVFAARDRAIPEDSLPLAAPLFAGELNVPPQIDPTPNPGPQPVADPAPQPPSAFQLQNAGSQLPDPCESFRLFGWELCLRPELLAQNDIRQDAASQKKSEAPAPRQTQSPGNSVVTRAGGRGVGQKDNDNDRAMNEFWNRAQTTGKGIKEAQQSYDSQLMRNPYSQNYIGPNDPRNVGNSLTTGNTTNTGNKIDKQEGPPPVLPNNTKGYGNSIDDSAKVKELAAKVRPLTGVAGEAARASLMELAEKDALKKALELETLLRGLTDGGSWFRRSLPSDEGIKTTPRAPNDPKPIDANAAPAVKPTEPQQPAQPAQPTPPTPGVGLSQPIAIHLGSMRPQWITAPNGAELLMLVRTARFENKTVYQGVVLDWVKLQEALHEEVKDLFPEAKLVPVRDAADVSPDRAMTALPVQLDPGPRPPLPPAGWTTLRIGLVLAWVAAIVAFAAVGFSGWTLIDLAERRIRFVSAVTHELRTPLTSLRLYLDLLVSGMIQDEEKRREYLNTLTVESDRLHRLIDNVLDFAKLEKRAKNGDVKPVPVGELLEQLRQTWTDRVGQDDKELVVISTLPPEREVKTDPAMLHQIVGNLIDNARKYTRDAADRRIWLWAKLGPGDAVVLEVEDRGPGVPPGERRSIFKPFRRGEQADSRAGGAGLGLALAKSWAEVLGAKLTYRPAECGTGACFRLELPGK